MLLGPYRRRHQTAPSNYNPVLLDVGTHTYQANTSPSRTVVDLIDVSIDAKASKDPVGPPPNDLPTTEPRDTPAPVMPPAADPLSEFDEYGTELHADARVWKVYVKETDKYDADLVKEWNDSTDVILIFAALFSAVSAAFIIESSKMLKEDPADVSAQSLLVIAQTLLARTNGTQPPGSTIQANANAIEFTPTRTAIYVNVLWYLSLSLSLAASFIAILSKDWCHSFMSGRTGQPYSQTRRRQQKWEMIEKWKMFQLLVLLPSLIHVALLLFSVGLCVYLWDMQATVAIPVLCVTGIAIAFYIWSSLSAITVDYSPYPTIISRLYRSDAVQHMLHHVSTLASRLASYPLVRNLYQSTWVLQLTILWIVKWFLLLPAMLFIVAVAGLEDHVGKCDQYISQAQPLVKLVGFPVSNLVWFLLLYPANWAGAQLVELVEHLEWAVGAIRRRMKKANWGLDWDQPDVGPVPQGYGHRPEQDAVTSRALSWLIANCEAPESVDIALQAIAGGTTRISKQPLLDCGATLEILKRLASSNLYRGSLAQRDAVISLYRRALTFLGSSSDSDQEPTGSELEGLIYDLHVEAEKNVAGLIVGSNFKPTQGNLDALQIGNTVALKTLKILKPGPFSVLTDVEPVISGIVRLLQEHLSGSDTLHEAALVSLLNAASLISPFAHGIPSASHLPMLCTQLVNSQRDLSTSHASHASLVACLATTCILSCAKFTDLDRLGEPESRSRLAKFVRGMTEGYSLDGRTLWMRSMIGLEMVLARPDTYHLMDIDQEIHEILLEDVASCIVAIWEGFYQASRGRAGLNDTDTYLQTLQGAYCLVPDGAPRTSICFFTLVPMETLWSHPYFRKMTPGDVWARFPTHSRTLIQLVEKCNFIPQLEKIIDEGEEHQRFIAMGQLWLLFALYFDTSNLSADDQYRLGTQLRRYRPQYPECEIVRHGQLGDQLEEMWASYSRIEFFQPRLEWITRLMECVFQSRNCPLPEDLYQLQEGYEFPQEIRGLSSFTTWRPLTETKESNMQQSACSLGAQTYGEHAISANDTVPGVGIMVLGDVPGDIDMHGCPSVCGDGEETQQLGRTRLGRHGSMGRVGQQGLEGENTQPREVQRAGCTESEVGGGDFGPGRVAQGGDEAHLLIEMYPLGAA